MAEPLITHIAKPYFRSMNVTCISCGLRQDPDHPKCVHLTGRKGGKKTATVLTTRYGTEHFQAIGRKGAAVRWAKRRSDGTEP